MNGVEVHYRGLTIAMDDDIYGFIDDRDYAKSYARKLTILYYHGMTDKDLNDVFNKIDSIFLDSAYEGATIASIKQIVIDKMIELDVRKEK